MAEQIQHIYNKVDHNTKEIINFSIEKLSSHPTGSGLYNGRMWQLTTDDRTYIYAGSTIHRIVQSTDLNTFGKLVGGHDASGGSVPTTGSGVENSGVSDNSIQNGDTWRITVAGTIQGLSTGSGELSVGDILIAIEDDPTDESGFMAIQKNDPDTTGQVLSYTDIASFPSTGINGNIYIAEDTGITYVWHSSAYQVVGESLNKQLIVFTISGKWGFNGTVWRGLDPDEGVNLGTYEESIISRTYPFSAETDFVTGAYSGLVNGHTIPFDGKLVSIEGNMKGILTTQNIAFTAVLMRQNQSTGIMEAITTFSSESLVTETEMNKFSTDFSINNEVLKGDQLIYACANQTALSSIEYQPGTFTITIEKD